MRICSPAIMDSTYNLNKPSFSVWSWFLPGVWWLGCCPLAPVQETEGEESHIGTQTGLPLWWFKLSQECIWLEILGTW